MPSRRSLPHDVPSWIDPGTEIYFVTVCCRTRPKNQLATDAIAPVLLDTIAHRNANCLWFAHLAVVMPDHVHLLLSVPAESVGLQALLSRWKEWTAKKLTIVWQRDFFEHRLRRETESFSEKVNYIAANPVRAGLVESAEDWPYIYRGKQTG